MMRLRNLAVVAVFLWVTVSCARQESPLVGHWQAIEDAPQLGPAVVDMTFHSDGTYKSSLSKDGVFYAITEGTWTLDGQWLSYKSTRTSVKGAPTGSLSRDKVVALSSDHLVLESSDGRTRDYRSIR